VPDVISNSSPLQGRLQMRFRDRDVWLEPGEMIVVPRGVEHCPVVPEEVHLLLFEPAGTRYTGNLENDLTAAPQRLA
jgi:mannose-6-phosphate isomerase-like protein (cupin superfamily)